ncbi:MAG: sensor histidine kinase [Cyanobacteria bacterium P01_D01_bin.128]
MEDLGLILLDQQDDVIERWIRSVRHDDEIDSGRNLPHQAIRNSIPLVLQAIATLLSDLFTDRPDKLERNSLEHGVVRADQGFDTSEVVREYRILREIVLDVLEDELCNGSAQEVLQAVREVEKVLDEVIFISLSSYVEHRLQGLRQVQAQLTLTNQEMHRLVQSQKENLSQLAHEFKTPLNAIIGYSTLLFRNQQRGDIRMRDPARELEQIERVVRNGQQLLRLVNDALEVSRYESGQIRLNLERVELPLMIHSVVELFELSAQEKDLTLTINCDRAPQEVSTDKLRLQQIMTNLLSNALRYTEAGEIQITCYTVEPDQWAIAVADTGIGIGPEQQEKIFQPFFRMTSAEQSEIDGTGLGLAIVSKLVALFQGNIEVDSTEGEGSTFTVTFPQEYPELGPEN